MLPVFITAVAGLGCGGGGGREAFVRWPLGGFRDCLQIFSSNFVSGSGFSRDMRGLFW